MRPKRGELQKINIANEVKVKVDNEVAVLDKVTISDWMKYLDQISSINLNFYLTLSSMLIGFSAIMMALIVYVNTRLEGLSTIIYTIEVLDPENNINKISLNFTKIPGLIENAYFIILIVAVVMVSATVFYFNRSKKTLRAKTAGKLSHSILSRDYPTLKNIDAIEDNWKKLENEIDNLKFWERSKFLKKKDEEPFNLWFNSIIERSSAT